MKLLLLPFIVWDALLTSAAVYSDISQLPTDEFDFVVVGGGTAGSVLANRLTENPDFSVLVLEAGPSNEGALLTQVPFFCNPTHPQYDYNFSTVAQIGLDNRVIAFPRGYILGGSSSVNGLFYSRGTIDDFDRYANVTGDVGWSWKSLQPYIFKNEKFTLPADRHNISGEYNPAVHSTTGMNSVSLPGYPQAIDDRVLQASKELGDEFTFNLDHNSGRHLGLGWAQTTIGGANRSSAATSYLAPSFTSRKNLHVLVNTRVTKLLETTQSAMHKNQCGPEIPRIEIEMRTVEFTRSQKGPRNRVTATKEVLLSAGSIGTPHLLMLSGIGPKSLLSTLGIQSVLDNPSVGQNLSDHTRLGSNFFVNSTNTFDDISRNDTLKNDLLSEWETKGMGPLVDTFINHITFIRLNESILERYGDPSAGLDSGHIELGVSNGLIGTTLPPKGHFIGITTRVVSPTSRGSVTLNSTDPFDKPFIDPAYLTTEFDVVAMRESVKEAVKFLKAPVWDDYILDFQPLGMNGSTLNDAEIDEYVRGFTGTSAHPVGTAAMSSVGAGYGVVNPDLRVKELEGLRIVDASIFPFVPSVHTQAPVYIIAERAADLIKDRWMGSGLTETK